MTCREGTKGKITKECWTIVVLLYLSKIHRSGEDRDWSEGVMSGGWWWEIHWSSTRCPWQCRKRLWTTVSSMSVCEGGEHFKHQPVNRRLSSKVDQIFILSVTLSQEHGLTAFGNRVLGRRFGPKRDEETDKWRRMSNEEVRIIYIYIYTHICIYTCNQFHILHTCKITTATGWQSNCS